MVRSNFSALLSVAVLASLANAQAPSVVPGAYVVELEAGHDASQLYKDIGDEVTTRMNLSYRLFKGASIQFTDISTAEEKAAKMASLSAVKAVYPVKTYRIPKPQVLWTGKVGQNYTSDTASLKKRQGNANDTFATHVMTQVDKLRAEGATGHGIKIGVIDTGIDYLHPALGGCFGPGCLVSYGTDLVGDAYDGFNAQAPDSDPMDCGGHGTHVAGIIAAQENPLDFTGAAPGVTLGAYKVFGCDGEVANDVLIAAYNLAFEAGSDIITASIGGASGWSEEPWAVAVQRIVEAGVPCTVAAGNSGSEGMWFASTAANGKRVTAIASFDSTEVPIVVSQSTYTVDGGEPVDFPWAGGVPSAWDDVKLPLWAVSFDTTDPANGCDPYPTDTPDLSGYIVLIRRGTCTFVQKAQNAAAKGAKYIVIYDNVPGATIIDVQTVPEIRAMATTTSAVGATWISALKGGSQIILQMAGVDVAENTVIYVDSQTGGFVSTFSSWGPTWEGDTKPQFGTPGGQILSTYPRSQGSYARLSGTSMATPLAAGIVALIAEVRGTLDPQTIESLLSSTAHRQFFNDGSRTSGLLAPVPQQGAGIVQAYDAAHSSTVLSVSSLSFNDTDHFAPSLSFTIRNTGKADTVYELSNIGAATAYTFSSGDINTMPFPNELVETHASLEFSKSQVSVPAGGEAEIEVSATPPSGLDPSRLPVWSGWIALNGSDGSILSLPYQGILGSLHSATVLGGAVITNSNDDEYNAVPPNSTFVLPKPNGSSSDTNSNTTAPPLPAVAMNLVMGSAYIRCDIIPLTTYAPNITTEVFGVKTIGQPKSFPSLWSSRGVQAVTWDGQLADGSYAPAGRYKFSVKALHIFGNETSIGDYDVSETQEFGISYTQ